MIAVELYRPDELSIHLSHTKKDSEDVVIREEEKEDFEMNEGDGY